jgi:hypothetical protein
MYSGDVLENGEVKTNSPYRSRLLDGELTHLVDEQYAEEIKRKQNPKLLSANDAAELADELRRHMASRISATGLTLKAEKFCIVVTDVAQDNCLNIDPGKAPELLVRTPEPDNDCRVVIRAPSRILRYAMKYEFGGDAIGIGYGADFHLRDRDAASGDLDQICYQLLTRVPTRKTYLRDNPRRVAGYLLRQPPVRTWRSWRRSAGRTGATNYDRSIWLLRDAEELRETFGLPAIEEERNLTATDTR